MKIGNKGSCSGEAKAVGQQNMYCWWFLVRPEKTVCQVPECTEGAFQTSSKIF